MVSIVRSVILGLILLSGNGAAVAENDDYEIWIDGIWKNSTVMTVLASAVVKKDATVTYEMLTETHSDGGNKARTRQSGKVNLKAGVKKELCEVKLGQKPAADHYFTVRLYSGRTVVAEASARY